MWSSQISGKCLKITGDCSVLESATEAHTNQGRKLRGIEHAIETQHFDISRTCQKHERLVHPVMKPDAATETALAR